MTDVTSDDTSDRAAEALAAMRERAAQITDEHDEGDCDLNGGPCTGHDAVRLIAAAIAALELADAWRWQSEHLDAAAELAAIEAPAEPGAALKHARSVAYDECARYLEAAIERALTGEDKADGA